MNTEQVHAGIGRRIGARVLDWLIVAVLVVIGQVLLAVTDGVVWTVLGVLLVVLALGVAIYNQVIRVGRRGESIGKQFLGLRVLDQDSREPIGIGRALGREVVNSLLFAACWIPGIVNLVITAKDVRRQGWHDKAASSLVITAASPGSSPTGSDSTDRTAAQPAPRPPSLATDPTGATGSTGTAAPYAPSAPPPAPRTAPPPPVPTAEDDGPIETTVTSKPSTPMVAPPPGMAPPPPDTPTETRAEQTIAPEPDEVPEQAPPTPSRGVPVEASQSAWRLTTPTGSTRRLEGLLLVGRDPDAELVPGAEAWAVDDPRLTMSKTHALLGVEDGTAWVEDWHSTNGVALHRGEAALVIEPHARTPLRDGDVIEFGAYKVTVEVGS